MTAAWPIKLLFAATMTIAGFLLFQVQPVMAKFILPWFGGSATTWTVCLLFFQLALLAGYAYVYAVTAPLTHRQQVVLHVVVLALSLITLPITPSEAFKPGNADNPTGKIMALLAFSVGLPYTVLSTTSPLLQRWLAHLDRNLLASRFFALSNFGSFLGLLSYPFLFEPNLSSPEQTALWSRAFLVFVALMAICSLVVLRTKPVETHGGTAVSAIAEEDRPDRFGLWLLYSGLGSVLLLAATNQMTQWTAVIPFLWILPLSLYLGTFIVAFGHQNLYNRFWFFVIFAVLMMATFILTPSDPDELLLPKLILHAATMTAGCMICHGEMVRLQPPSRRLPRFYMASALGGALGGISVALIAPRIFSDYWEYPIAIVLTALISATLNLRTASSGAKRLGFAAASLGVLISMGYAITQALVTEGDVIDRVRNFYGVVKVIKENAGDPRQFTLTMVQAGEPQGSQYQAPDRRREPYCAFSPVSGIGRTLAALRARPDKKPLKIGSVGLGVGVLAALGQSGDTIRVYELNPAVSELANKHFSFIKESAATITLQHGDGRILLERELLAGTPGNYDLIVVDAFRGASPPLHLMTKEAFEIYLKHLAPGGILAINFEIDIFRLDPLHRGLAASHDLQVRWIETPDAGDDCDETVSWALYSRDARLFDGPEIKPGVSRWRDGRDDQLIWTDASANLLSIVNWGNLLGRVRD